ncbi:MAG: hypothetical protein GY869_22075, partial [Planctomycetes bacterium]|nr:hypothetical protein [Planctomycetota bacterium]
MLITFCSTNSFKQQSQNSEIGKSRVECRTQTIHVFTNRSYDELCLSDPQLIRQIHADYCDAGADVLTTNTFGAGRVALEKFGLAEKLREINRAGARLARETADGADRPVFVAGSIGPL